MASEKEIQQAVLLALGGRADCRLFRNNTGTGWTGDVLRRPDGSIVIRHPRPLHAGLHVGSPDLVGWQSIVVTPEMVGRRLAVFAGFECKSTAGRASDAQEVWRANVLRHGGISGVVRSVEEATSHLIGGSIVGPEFNR